MVDLALDRIGQERRREPRLAVRAAASISARSEQQRARVLNVSCSGALIAGSADPNLPAMHTIAMHLGSGEPLRLLARTVWSSTDRHAVAFVALDDVDRLAIAEHIDQFLARVA